MPAQAQCYFDGGSNLYKSTVGSASATGSIPDSTGKMSEDAEDNASSAGMSDDGDVSLVGFGEAASSSHYGQTPSAWKMSSSNSAFPSKTQNSLRQDSLMDTHSSSGGLYGGQEAEKIIGETMRHADGTVLEGADGKALGTFAFEGK